MRAVLLLLLLAAAAAAGAGVETTPLEGARVFVHEAPAHKVAAAAAAEAETVTVTAEGVLEVVHSLPREHSQVVPRDVFVLHEDSGRTVSLQLDDLPRDVEHGLYTMQRLAVRGRRAAREDVGELRVHRLEARHTVESLEANPRLAAHALHEDAPARARLMNSDYKANPAGSMEYLPLYVPLNFRVDGEVVPHDCGTPDEMQSLLDEGYYAANDDDALTVSGVFKYFSKGRAFVKTYNVTDPYNTNFDLSSCTDTDFNAWSNEARRVAQAQGHNLNDFSSVVAIVPRGVPCAWAGRASLFNCVVGRGNICRSVVNYCDEFVVSHELGHNLNLHHSAEDTRDTQNLADLNSVYVYYKDWSCLMGNRNSWNLLNAAKLIEKSWIHEDRVLFLDSDNPVTMDVQLEPLDVFADAGGGVARYQVIAFRDSASGQYPVKTYYISIRRKEKYTSRLENRYVDHAAVHTSSSAKSYSYYVQSLSEPKTTTHARWTFEEVSITPGQVATIRVTAPSTRTYSWTNVTTTCSVTCGAGTRTITQQCWNSDDQQVSDSLCEGEKAPAVSIACDEGECPEYEWHAADYGPCTVACGGGIQTRDVQCRVKGTTTAAEDDSLCDPSERPATARACNTARCPTYSWAYGEFGDCSVSCGSGVRTRSVQCVNETNGNAVVSDSLCENEAESATKPCAAGPCPGEENEYEYSAGPWSSCNATCGTSAYRKRAVHCTNLSDLAKVADDNCEGQAKPASLERCAGLPPCEEARYGWDHGAWSACSARCGGGNRTRSVRCLRWLGGAVEVASDSMCSTRDRPDETETCNEERCAGGCADEDKAACGPNGACAAGDDNTTVCVCDPGYAGDGCGDAPSVYQVSLEYAMDQTPDMTVEWRSTGAPLRVTVVLHYREDAGSPFHPLPLLVASNVLSQPGSTQSLELSTSTEVFASTGSGQYVAEVRYTAAVSNRSEAVTVELPDACEAGRITCQNGRPCADGACVCGPDFEGSLCEHRVEGPCDSSLCQNGAECYGDGLCNCTAATGPNAPYSGRYCDAWAGCDMACENDGIVEACALCLCHDAWEGERCETCGLEDVCQRGKPNDGCAACACVDGVTGAACDRAFLELWLGPFSDELLELDEEHTARFALALEAAIYEALGLPSDSNRFEFVGLRRNNNHAVAVFRLFVFPGPVAAESAGAQSGAASKDGSDAALSDAHQELAGLVSLLKKQLGDPSSQLYVNTVTGLLPAGKASLEVAPDGDGGDGGGSSSSGLSAGATAAIALVVVAVVAGMVFGGVMYQRRRKSSRRAVEGRPVQMQSSSQLPSYPAQTGAAAYPYPAAQQPAAAAAAAAAQPGAAYATGEPQQQRGPAPPLPPRPGTEGLPSGWSQYVDDDGNPYYYHETTGVSQWHRPV